MEAKVTKTSKMPMVQSCFVLQSCLLLPVPNMYTCSKSEPDLRLFEFKIKAKKVLHPHTKSVLKQFLPSEV